MPESTATPQGVPLVGVVALQGAAAEHVAALRRLGAGAIEVRTPAQLDGVNAVVLPGGESTTMSHLLGTSGLFDALAERLAAGMPAFGTCAGMILLAAEVLDGRPDQRSFGAIDISVRRNAFGRQVASFEADVPTAGLSESFHAVFIRAPWVERIGDDVEVLATVVPSNFASGADEVPVLCRSGSILVSSFHPELTPDHRIHQMFLNMITAA